MFREFLVEPSYEIYLVGEEDKIRKVHSALLNPVRPLYLGGSDDLVDLEVHEPVEVEEAEANELWCVAEGIHEGCLVQKVPYKFVKAGKSFDVVYKTVSVPYSSPVKVMMRCVKIHDECVVVL